MAGSVIHIRRIKDSDDLTTVLCESEEYFNDEDEFDVTCLNIAKPGELFKVVHPNGGTIFETTLTRREITGLLCLSDWLYVIEQEDWATKIMQQREEQRSERGKMTGPWVYSWWFRKLNAAFKLDNSLPGVVREEYHLHFMDQDDEFSVPAYAYQGHKTLSPVNHNTHRIPHVLDDPPPNDPSEFSVITTAVDGTLANHRVT